jgi:HlyD family type I secretion membrane fusion protein
MPVKAAERPRLGKWASWSMPAPAGEPEAADIRALLERRRSPVAGLLIGSVALMLTAGVAWTAWARIDEVVKAQGEVEPAARVKLINHPRGGRIATLQVAEGERVEAGQVLLTFAPEIDAKEQAELRGRWQGRLAEVALLRAEIEEVPIAPPPDLLTDRPDLVAEAEKRLIARRDAREGQREALRRNVEGHRAALLTAEAEIDRLASGSELLGQQFEAVRELAERGLYPRLKMVEIERQLADSRGELAKARAELASARAALAESESRQKAFDKDWHRELLEQLSAAMAERDRLAEQLGAQTAVVEELVVKAPVAGIVQELKPAAAGQSLAANEPILKLVPVGDGLVIKAMVANPDIGRVAPGMPATVKVRAYDFARFGAIEGSVTRISADAITGDTPGELPSFAVEVATQRDHMGADGSLPVLPGMVVDVELRVGERTILSYLTDTLTTMKERAFKEG